MFADGRRFLFCLILLFFIRCFSLVLYSFFVARVTLSLSGDNSIGVQGAEALARGLPDSQITYLDRPQYVIWTAAKFGALQ